MNLIENKKGNSGYTITGWDFSFSSNYHNAETGEFDRNGSELNIYSDRQSKVLRTEITAMMRDVTVHSCGKKELKLFANDIDSLMRGTNFSPSTQIFVTEQDARGYFTNEWDTWIKASIVKQVKREVKRSEEYIGKQDWAEERVRVETEFLAKVESGEVTYKVLTYDEGMQEIHSMSRKMTGRKV